jgi:ferredoxin-NADP reductase
MKLKLVNKSQEAQNTKSFFFEPEKKIEYLPGQHFYYTIPKLKYPDTRGNTRQFTIANSPTEGNFLMLTTKIRPGSGFKKTLDELELGAVINGEGPSGTFIMDDYEIGKNALLAGGIGVTPFRCFIEYTIDKKLNKNTIHLIYSSSTYQEIAYFEELRRWSDNNPNVTTTITITQPDKSVAKWTGLTGRIDSEMIKTNIEDYLSANYWLCGPPNMVTAIEKMLKNIKISSQKIRTEKFTGY